MDIETMQKKGTVFTSCEDEKLVLGDVKVDINPITSWKSGTLENYMPQAEEHLKQAQKKKQEYKPLSKVEELEEENYNQIDNHLNNTKPRAEEIREQKQEAEERKRRTSSRSRPSLLARMREKQAIQETEKQENKIPEKFPKEERII